MLLQNIPILHIFDEAEARAFYIGWLGFNIDFEHRFEPGMPLYMGISRDNIRLHLSGHEGDTSPHTRVFITCNRIEQLRDELLSRPYKNYQPVVEDTFYGTRQLSLHDPFGNRLSFNEYL